MITVDKKLILDAISLLIARRESVIWNFKSGEDLDTIEDTNRKILYLENALDNTATVVTIKRIIL